MGHGALILQRSGLKILGIDRKPTCVDACDTLGVLAYNQGFSHNSDGFQPPFAAVFIDVLHENKDAIGMLRHMADKAEVVIFTIKRERLRDVPPVEILGPETHVHRLPGFHGQFIVEWRNPSSLPLTPPAKPL